MIYLLYEGDELRMVEGSFYLIYTNQLAFQTMTLMIAFSYFFTMKRVEIQMNDSNNTVI